MNDKVIYTCLVGEYDDLAEPSIVYDNFDYICFVGHKTENTHKGIWEIRYIPFECPDQTRLSRFPKINPHLVLKEYKYSIYIDANIIIVDDFLQKRVNELIQSGAIWAQVRHPFLNNIYEDIIRCVKMAKEKISVLRSQYKFLKNEGYPEDYVLYENNVLFREHNNSNVIAISEAWWTQYMMISKRDQQSLCYILWKKNFKSDLILPKEYNVRNHPGFRLNTHLSTVKQQASFKYKNYRNRLIMFLFGSILFK